MARTESTYSERVGARISPELKICLKDMVDDERFDSEADVVREALWHYVEQHSGSPLPPPRDSTVPTPAPDSAHTGAPVRAVQDQLEWSMSVLIVLLATIGSRLLNGLRGTQVRPAELVDEAIQEAVYNHDLLWHKLRIGRRVLRQQDEEEAKG